jgi:anthranilate phosphoribosyltransferase
MHPQPHLKQIIEGRATLTREAARALMQQILASEFSEIQLAALLGALAARGETAAEITGFVETMRAAATPLPLNDAERRQLVDTCGTGGDTSGTFNISTATALVAAAAGATVAKHGNRAVTSQCGSADILEALGVPVDLSPPAAVAALRKHRFAFLHAPAMHPAMKAVMPVRRALTGVRTVFNVLGPLTNPAGAAAQVMGVYAPHLVPLVAEAMALLGTRHAFVVHGDAGNGTGGLDEISISGPSQIAEVRSGTVILSTLTPEEVGFQRASIETLRGGNAETNGAILEAIFAGERSPRRDIVLLNAAAVLVASDLARTLLEGVAIAARAIDSGAVKTLLTTLRT